MLNSDFAHQQAAAFADRINHEYSDDAERVRAAYRLAMGRPPVSEEIQEGVDYLRSLEPLLEQAGVSPQERAKAAWKSYLRVLLSSNEFLFVD
jgi:hypothetical protein